MATAGRISSKVFATDEAVLDALLLLDLAEIKDLMAGLTALEVCRMSPSIVDELLNNTIEEFPKIISQDIGEF